MSDSQESGFDADLRKTSYDIITSIAADLEYEFLPSKTLKPLDLLFKACGYSYPALSKEIKKIDSEVSIRPESLKTCSDDDLIKIGLRGGLVDEDKSRIVIPRIFEIVLPKKLKNRKTYLDELTGLYTEKLNERVAEGVDTKSHAKKVHQLASGIDDRKINCLTSATVEKPDNENETELASDDEWQAFLNRNKNKNPQIER